LNKQNGGKPETQNLITLTACFRDQSPPRSKTNASHFCRLMPCSPQERVSGGITKDQIEWFIKASGNPDETRSALLDQRTVVRAANARTSAKTLATLTKYPALQTCIRN
jgi:hypothetical protein